MDGSQVPILGQDLIARYDFLEIKLRKSGWLPILLYLEGRTWNGSDGLGELTVRVDKAIIDSKIELGTDMTVMAKCFRGI